MKHLGIITFDEAFRLVSGVARPIAAETVPIEAAAGRVLAQPVQARVDSPRCDVSAMDGYAVRDCEIQTLPARLQVAGESFAGRGWNGRLGPGKCARIFTGAPVPAGADRVVIQENVERNGETAIINGQPGTSRHIRARGSDFRCGDELLTRGQLLHARALVAAAAADVPELEVFTQPCISILSTGDELAPPGSAATKPQMIPESVSYGIAAMVEAWGGTVVSRRRLRDDLHALEQVAEHALRTSDLVIVTGGASVGERDFAKDMFRSAGLEIIFAKVAIKPGKPVWLGRAGHALVLGLPGNPTSALVTARLLLAPLVAGLSGRSAVDALKWRAMPLAAPLPDCGVRETFHRARSCGGSAELFSFQDSSAQKVLARADILVRQRARSESRKAGDLVEILDF